MIAYEVEQKFPVADLESLSARLAALGVEVSAAHVETDLYFAHPSRNFAETDEALRVRRKGGKNFITYKGPKVDATTKTRQEIELPLEPGEGVAAAWAGLLQALHFTPVAEVFKSRRKAFVVWQGRRIEVSLDDVEGAGTYAELELVVGPDELGEAKAAIASLAEELGLQQSERRSYLQLMLLKRAADA
jgi:adenylate cyclase class 2